MPKKRKSSARIKNQFPTAEELGRHRSEVACIKMRGFTGTMLKEYDDGMVRLAFATRPYGLLYDKADLQELPGGRWLVL